MEQLNPRGIDDGRPGPTKHGRLRRRLVAHGEARDAAPVAVALRDAPYHPQRLADAPLPPVPRAARRALPAAARRLATLAPRAAMEVEEDLGRVAPGPALCVSRGGSAWGRAVGQASGRRRRPRRSRRRRGRRLCRRRHRCRRCRRLCRHRRHRVSPPTLSTPSPPSPPSPLSPPSPPSPPPRCRRRGRRRRCRRCRRRHVELGPVGRAAGRAVGRAAGAGGRAIKRPRIRGGRAVISVVPSRRQHRPSPRTLRSCAATQFTHRLDHLSIALRQQFLGPILKPESRAHHDSTRCPLH